MVSELHASKVQWLQTTWPLLHQQLKNVCECAAVAQVVCSVIAQQDEHHTLSNGTSLPAPHNCCFSLNIDSCGIYRRKSLMIGAIQTIDCKLPSLVNTCRGLAVTFPFSTTYCDVAHTIAARSSLSSAMDTFNPLPDITATLPEVQIGFSTQENL